MYLPFERLKWAPVVCLWLKFIFMDGVMCESGWSGQSKGTNHAHVTDKFHKVLINEGLLGKIRTTKRHGLEITT